jgi:two-component system chemotaxis sensor kinase CheA
MSESKAPLQTSKQVELIHTSLLGLVLICLVVTAGLMMPVVGLHNLDNPYVAATIVITVCVGVMPLYTMNLRAHKLVLAQARLTDVLINSLGQGFLTFDQKGICGPVYSQACHTLLLAEEIVSEKIAKVLRVPEGQHTEFEEWLQVLFMPGHALSFEDAVRFLPDAVKRDDGRTVEISYRPVREKDGTLSRIVLIATDRTEEREAQKRADQERQFAAMICAIFAERQSFILTMTQANELLDQLSRYSEGVLSDDFFRGVHTIKGAAMHFKMEKLGEALHNLEQQLREAKGAAPAELRERLDNARAEVHLEYGRIQNALRDILGGESERPQGLIEVDEESIYNFGKLLKQQRVSPDIYFAYQSTILSVPLFSLLRSLDRQMLPLAEKMEKRVKPIVFEGESVRVPARPLQHLLLALTHVMHNILDHGIESPIARMAKGKDPQGEVRIHVSHVTDEEKKRWIQIIISDDGAGIDPNRVRKKLGESDPNGAWRFEDDETVVQNLLTSLISTKDEATMFSGRGAGMSAVYQEIIRLGGRARLKSEMHKGTQLVMLLPESLETLAE